MSILYSMAVFPCSLPASTRNSFASRRSFAVPCKLLEGSLITTTSEWGMSANLPSWKICQKHTKSALRHDQSINFYWNEARDLINTRKLRNAPEPLSTTPEDRGVGQFVKLVEFMCASNAESVRYDSMTSLMQQAFILRFQKRISHHQIMITLKL